jgi:hypothetical protein
LTMTANMGSVFRCANGACIFQNPDVAGLQLSHRLA